MRLVNRIKFFNGIVCFIFLICIIAYLANKVIGVSSIDYTKLKPTPIQTPIITKIVYVEKRIDYKIPLSEHLQNYLWDTCKKYKLNYELALSVIKTESDFNQNLIHTNTNGTKDYGLFQINSSNFKWLRKVLHIDNFLNPYENIEAGVFMLSDLKQRHTSYHKICIGYNMGEHKIKRLANRGITTTRYSKRVLKNKEQLEISGKFKD
jgi:soluble lytic murein transglycosylase-like protein